MKIINSLIEQIKKLNGNSVMVIKICPVVFFILISFLIVSLKFDFIKELFSENNVLYFPVRDVAELNRIRDIMFKEHRSYTITVNGFIKVENSEIARRTRTILISKKIIPSKLYPFINIDKVSDRVIRDTLDKVAKKFEAGEDANGDGETDCKDAAIWFYFLYPYKNDVKLISNCYLGHAYNTVKIGDTWKCIEPQAFLKTENRKSNTYLMEDIWGSQCDYIYNENGYWLLDFLFKDLNEDNTAFSERMDAWYDNIYK